VTTEALKMIVTLKRDRWFIHHQEHGIALPGFDTQEEAWKWLADNEEKVKDRMKGKDFP
jgi:hypothetical protein